MADKDKSTEEAKRLLGLLYDRDQQKPIDRDDPNAHKVPLFNNDDSKTVRYPPRKSAVISTKRAISYENPKHKWRSIPELQNIEVDLRYGRVFDASRGKMWIMPNDIAQLILKGDFERTADENGVDQEMLDAATPDYSDSQANTNCEPIKFGSPGYWLHFTEGRLAGKALPVYGYMWDLGRRAAAPPVLNDDDNHRDWDWDTCTWLQRCAQCGRELPPAAYYRLNGPDQKHRRQTLDAICAECERLNLNAKKFYDKPYTQRTYDEQDFIDEYFHLLDVIWKKGLSPRGYVAREYLGKDKVQQRVWDSRRVAEKRPSHRGRYYKNKFFTRYMAYMGNAISRLENDNNDDATETDDTQEGGAAE